MTEKEVIAALELQSDILRKIIVLREREIDFLKACLEVNKACAETDFKPPQFGQANFLE